MNSNPNRKPRKELVNKQHYQHNSDFIDEKKRIPLKENGVILKKNIQIQRRKSFECGKNLVGSFSDVHRGDPCIGNGVGYGS